MVNNIRLIRDWRHLTQQQLADKTGLARPYISILERGNGKPTIEIGVKIANALGVSLDDLFFNQNVRPDLQGLTSDKEVSK